MSPMTLGSRIPRRAISTCRSAGCGPWNRSATYCAPGTTAYRPSSALGASLRPWRPSTAARFCAEPSLPGAVYPPTPGSATGWWCPWPWAPWPRPGTAGAIPMFGRSYTWSWSIFYMTNELIAPRMVGLVLTALLLSACTPQSSSAATAAAAPVATSPSGQVPAAPLVRGLPDFSTLVEQVGPAVVNVTVVEKRQRNPMANPFSDNDPFSDFFRQFQQQQPRDLPPEEGVGSGFIVSAD